MPEPIDPYRFVVGIDFGHHGDETALVTLNQYTGRVANSELTVLKQRQVPADRIKLSWGMGDLVEPPTLFERLMLEE